MEAFGRVAFRMSALLRWRREMRFVDRMPLVIFFAVLILPPVIFGQGCRRILPGEKLRADDLILPAIGLPIALGLACVSLRGSSHKRRVGLIIVIVLSVIGLIQGLLKYW
jgi:hypothetical protein